MGHVARTRPAIESCDWRRFWPRALVIEATKPAPRPAGWADLESIAMWHDWEPIILANRYVFAYFDGLIQELTRLLRESEADRAARLEIHELTRLLRNRPGRYGRLLANDRA